MPITHNLYTLSSGSATLVVAPNTQPQQVYLHNATKSSNEYIYIGTQTVGTANSIHLDPGESLTVQLGPGDDLWAISDPNGLKLGVMVVKQD